MLRWCFPTPFPTSYFTNSLPLSMCAGCGLCPMGSGSLWRHECRFKEPRNSVCADELLSCTRKFRGILRWRHCIMGRFLWRRRNLRLVGGEHILLRVNRILAASRISKLENCIGKCACHVSGISSCFLLTADLGNSCIHNSRRRRTVQNRELGSAFYGISFRLNLTKFAKLRCGSGTWLHEIHFLVKFHHISALYSFWPVVSDHL